MSRDFHPHINEAGAPECAYAGCGQDVPADHFLCLPHYKKYQDELVGPCPALGCQRFRSLKYEHCADCGRAAIRETDPAWASGDEGCDRFYAYLELQDGKFYAGHTRSLRERVWEHQNDGEHTSAKLVWFQDYSTRADAAARELELKQLVMRNRRAVLSMMFQFQDDVGLVSPLL